MVQQRLGPMGLAGFFCNGEIGPVGERSFLHGYTASLAVREKVRLIYLPQGGRGPKRAHRARTWAAGAFARLVCLPRQATLEQTCGHRR